MNILNTNEPQKIAFNQLSGIEFDEMMKICKITY